MTLSEPINYSQDALRPRSPSGAEHRETALPEVEGKASDAHAPSVTLLLHGAERHATPLLGPTPSTLILQIGRGFQSPLSDDLTPQTDLSTPIANREVLSPLTEDYQTPSHLAANLAEKIMKNHAYQDGNKRTALLAAECRLILPNFLPPYFTARFSTFYYVCDYPISKNHSSCHSESRTFWCYKTFSRWLSGLASVLG